MPRMAGMCEPGHVPRVWMPGNSEAISQRCTGRSLRGTQEGLSNKAAQGAGRMGDTQWGSFHISGFRIARSEGHFECLMCAALES